MQYHIFCDGLVVRGKVEGQTMIDYSPGLGIGWIKLVVYLVPVSQVLQNCHTVENQNGTVLRMCYKVLLIVIS